MISINTKISLFYSFFILLFFSIPAFHYHGYGTLGDALSILSLVFFTLCILKVSLPKHFVNFYLSLILVFFLVQYLFLNSNFDQLNKFFFSIISLIIILFLTNFISKLVIQIDPKIILNFFCYLFYLFFVIGLIDILFFDNGFGNQIYPNTERSHFYLNFISIFLVILFRIKFIFLVTLISILLVLSPTITGLITLILILLLKIRGNLFIIPLISFPLIYLIFKFNSEYFLYRSIFEESLTVLSYLRGLSIITDMFNNDNLFLGYGFQQFSCFKDIIGNNYFTILIKDIYALENYQCLDASFVLSKIIFELGIIGILISFFFIYNSFKNFFIISSKLSKKKKYFNHEIFFRILMIPIIIDFLFRGYGYFSINFLLFFIGFFGIRYNSIR